MPKRGKPRCKRAGCSRLRERYGEFCNVAAYHALLRGSKYGSGSRRFEYLQEFTGRIPRNFPVRGSYVVREPDADSSSDDAVTVIVTLRPFDGSETVSSLEQAANRDAHTATAKMDLKKVFIVVGCVC